MNRPQCETNINATKNEWFARWIPVTERLPEAAGEYLVCDDLGILDIREWDGWNWNLRQRCNVDILAWMPLPDPYEEEQ